jgi:cellulose biosynthesis protein BcsQ
MARKIAVAIRKGGSGKTTTSINLATALLHKGQRVLLVDTDDQANATMGVGLNPSELSPTLNDLFANPQADPHTAIHQAYFGLHILPAHDNLARSEANMEPDDVFLLRPILVKLESDYDFIVIDTPPTGGYLARNALAAADEVIIPVRAGAFSRGGLSKALATIEKARRSNPTLKVHGILPVSVDNTQFAADLLEEIGDHPATIYPRHVPRTTYVDQANELGRLSRASWNLRWRSPPDACRVVGVGQRPSCSTEGDRRMPKDTHPTLPAGPGLVLPERVTTALAELAGAAREGLLALAVGAGIGVLTVLLDADVERLVGPKGRHNPDRAAVRHGTQPGRVTLGGRRVRVDRPRVRTVDGSGEVPLTAWEAFATSELLDQLTLERMLAKLSTRRYQAGLEPVGEAVEQAVAAGTSKSAVSRRFVAATEHALAGLMSADLSGLDLVALMVDGVRVAEHTCVVALGITIDGTKVPLGLAEGATENATVVRDLLASLRDRGLDVTRPILVVVDGAKALRRAVDDVFDHPVVQRCQLQ